MKDLKEKDIQSAIIEYLRLTKYHVFKHHSTGFTVRDGKNVAFRYGDVGIADIIGCCPGGRFLAIEVKRPKHEPSDAQAAFIEAIRQQGGIAFCAHSLDECIAELRAAQG